MGRLFFAVGMAGHPGASTALASLQATLERGMPPGCLRLSVPDQTHFTLRFLGETSSDQREAALLAGGAAAVGSAPFDLGFGPLGVFPDERRAHTLWIGAGHGAEELVRLARELDRRLVEAGFAGEPRPFVPHLTLARVKRRPPFGTLRTALETWPGPLATVRVESFLLLESVPTKSGARYVPLANFRLETTCTPSK